MAAAFRSYDVEDGSVTGFHDMTEPGPFTADAGAPRLYAFPTFSDPNGTIRLVRITSGQFTGTYVSPTDPGVRYRPGG